LFCGYGSDGGQFQAHGRGDRGSLPAWLVPTIEKFPKSYEFTIGDRIETIAIDVLKALIEATYTMERTQHLRQANLGIEKLRFFLDKARAHKRARCEERTSGPRIENTTSGGWPHIDGQNSARTARRLYAKISPIGLPTRPRWQR
jgi:hypothetical protein